MPASTRLVDQRGPEYARPGDGHVLRASQVIAFVMAPDWNLGFVGIVENIPSGNLILARKIVVHASREIPLRGNGARGRGQIIERSVAGVGHRLEIEKRLSLRTQGRLRNHVAHYSDVQRVFQRDWQMSTRVLQATEVTVTLLQRGNNLVNRGSALRSIARFPVEEKECLVFSVIQLRE